MSPLARAANGAVDVLDGGRRWMWRQVVRTSAGRSCARDRSMRVLALGLGHLAVSLVLVAIAPQYLLLLGPIVFGVPHVIADVRYLVVRGPRSLQAVTVFALAVPLAGLAALGVVGVTGHGAPEVADMLLGFAAIAIAVALAPSSSGSSPSRSPSSPRGARGGGRRALVAIGALAIAVPAIAYPRGAQLVLLHGHNLVGFGIWLGFTQKTVRLGHRVGVAAAVALATAAVLAGAFDGLGQNELVAAFGPALAPDLDDVVAYRVVLSYLLLQAFHYVVWLRLIPTTQSAAPAASTFRKSLVSLASDFRLVGLVGLALAVISVPIAAAAFDLEQVRDVYLSLAIFHAWLELSMIGYLLVSRERLGEP